MRVDQAEPVEVGARLDRPVEGEEGADAVEKEIGRLRVAIERLGREGEGAIGVVRPELDVDRGADGVAVAGDRREHLGELRPRLVVAPFPREHRAVERAGVGVLGGRFEVPAQDAEGPFAVAVAIERAHFGEEVARRDDVRLFFCEGLEDGEGRGAARDGAENTRAEGGGARRRGGGRGVFLRRASEARRGARAAA